MVTIAANDLKTKGIKALEDTLRTQSQVSLSVLGQIKYIVMSQDYYLRECELEAASAESKAKPRSGDFVKETITEHLKVLRKLNKVAK